MKIEINTDVWKDTNKIRKTLHNAGIIKLVVGNLLLIGVIFGQGHVISVLCGIFLGSLGGIEMISWNQYSKEEEAKRQAKGGVTHGK